MASRLGEAAIEALMDGQRNILLGIDDDQVVAIPFSKAIKKDKPIDPELLKVLKILSI
ncbi:MAG: 6-phosphofructokinase [Bacteroidetes bacterium ADurb.Bin416]|nr:MAG: 6-phosphofructokinase [Bacteroidetes bacterium ADurb.Bin416]